MGLVCLSVNQKMKRNHDVAYAYFSALGTGCRFAKIACFPALCNAGCTYLFLVLIG